MAKPFFVADPLEKHPSSNERFIVDLSAALAAAETATGTPTVAIAPAGLTEEAGTAILASDETDAAGHTTAAGKGIAVRLSGGSDEVNYLMTVTYATTASNTAVAVCPMLVRSG